MFRTGAQMAILVLLTGLLLQREARWRPVAAFEEEFSDATAVADRYLSDQLIARHWRTPPRVSPVTLVGIDASSLADHPWPWSPLDYSLFLQASLPFHPEVTAIEQTLDWERVDLPPAERKKLPQYERILRDSLLRSPKVLLGARLGWPEDPDAAPPLQETPLLRRVAGNLREVPEWTVIDELPKEDFRLSASLGYTNLPREHGSANRMPLVLRYQGQVVPTLVLQAVLLWQRVSTDDVQVQLGSHVAIGRLWIPIDEQGRMRVNFAAPVTMIGFDELLLSSEQVAAKQKPVAPVERMTGSVTLLARTAPEARTIHPPLRPAFSPGEAFARAIATIQNDTFLWPAPVWLDYALLSLAVLAAFWIPQWRKRTAILWALGALLLYLLIALALFDQRRVLLPIVLPAGLLIFMGLYRAATPNYVWKLRRPVIL